MGRSGPWERVLLRSEWTTEGGQELRYERVCIPLWSLRHSGGDTIEISVNTHPVGLEFRASLNTQLLHSQVFRSPDELMQSAERSRGLLESRGWTMVEAETKA